MDFYLFSAQKTMQALGSNPQGLSAEAVRLRLAEYGPNQLKTARKDPLWQRVMEPFKSLFVFVLVIAAAISLISGKRLDTAVIMSVVVVNALIFYFQRLSADRILNSLKRQDTRSVQVIRVGQVKRVPPTALVPGDIVLLSEGVKVPADGRLTEADNLMIDESMLTGESLPAIKGVAALSRPAPIFQQTGMAFMGTMVVSGLGELLVTATGPATELGKIARLSESVVEPSPLQIKIDGLTKRIVGIVLVIATVAFGLSLMRGIAAAEALRFTLSLMVSAIPEGLPLTLTIVLLFGVKRMAKQKALVRNFTAVETLGQATVIATDKTGTLTMNRLAIADDWHPAGGGELRLAAWLSLATARGEHGDPLEQVILKEAESKAPAGWKRVKVMPFDQFLRISGAIWKSGPTHHIYIKGAPEAVLDTAKLSSKARAAAAAAIKQLSARGYRLIGFASKTSRTLPAKLTHELLHGFNFEGVLAFSDQLRPEITAAVGATQSAGIKVLMLTGDHLETAKSFGLQAGIIENRRQAREGSALSSLSLAGIRRLIGGVKVFARVLPEHKHHILDAFRGREITAMTGDGVNDVPAIVKADVGVAMGGGTDAAKEASDVILLDDNFATIVAAVREGRAILANVRKMVFYLFATNLGEVVTMLGALVIGLPLPITAIQILWINLITDGFAVIPLGLEPPEEGHMKTPPERHGAALLARHTLARVLGTAILMATLALTVFYVYLPSGILMAQSMAFAVLIVTQWANALNARSEDASFVEGFRRPNYLLYGAIFASFLLQLVVFFGPLKEVLQVSALGQAEAIVLAACVGAVLIGGDLFKKVFR